MTRLSQRDFATFSHALEALYADAQVGTLASRILGTLERLIRCEFASFSLLDVRQGCWHSHAMTPGVNSWPGTEAYQHFFWHDPAVAYVRSTRSSAAVKISDFVSLREYRSLGVCTELFGPTGCDRRMGFGVQNVMPVDLSVSLNRSGRDFSEEERALLDLLQPHLFQATSRVHTERLVHRQLERERAALGDAFASGLGEIDGQASPLWLTPRARSLLHDFFPPRGHHPTAERLPEELERAIFPTLQPGPRGAAVDGPAAAKRYVWRFEGANGGQLNVRLAAAEAPDHWYLLLEENPVPLPTLRVARSLRLTGREGEILHWLKQGKSNWSIGTILQISEKTVGKHLENIFRKLNVENRTAAVLAAEEFSGGR